MMGAMRDMEIVWEDLLDAFENTDRETMYFLDKETGEVFAVPVFYDDHEFWEQVMDQEDRFLKIPVLDYDQERKLLHELSKAVKDPDLKAMLDKALGGRLPFGKLHEILSFYPDAEENLAQLKEELLSVRIRRWLEENDIYPMNEEFE